MSSHYCYFLYLFIFLFPIYNMILFDLISFQVISWKQYVKFSDENNLLLDGAKFQALRFHSINKLQVHNLRTYRSNNTNFHKPFHWMTTLWWLMAVWVLSSGEPGIETQCFWFRVLSSSAAWTTDPYRCPPPSEKLIAEIEEIWRHFATK